MSNTRNLQLTGGSDWILGVSGPGSGCFSSTNASFEFCEAASAPGPVIFGHREDGTEIVHYTIESDEKIYFRSHNNSLIVITED